jgi:hypothetical protein
VIVALSPSSARAGEGDLRFRQGRVRKLPALEVAISPAGVAFGDARKGS